MISVWWFRIGVAVKHLRTFTFDLDSLVIDFHRIIEGIRSLAPDEERTLFPSQDIMQAQRAGKDRCGKFQLKEMTVLLVPKCHKVEFKCR